MKAVLIVIIALSAGLFCFSNTQPVFATEETGQIEAIPEEVAGQDMDTDEYETEQYEDTGLDEANQDYEHSETQDETQSEVTQEREVVEFQGNQYE